MKGDALLFMLLSWGIVLTLTTYCFSKLFNNRPRPGSKRAKTAQL